MCLLPYQKDLIVNFPHNEKQTKTVSYFCNEQMFRISVALFFSIMELKEGLSLGQGVGMGEGLEEGRKMTDSSFHSG